MANGSLMELETHLLLSMRLSYVSETGIQPLLTLSAEVGKMLAGLIHSLKKKT